MRKNVVAVLFANVLMALMAIKSSFEKLKVNVHVVCEAPTMPVDVMLTFIEPDVNGKVVVACAFAAAFCRINPDHDTEATSTIVVKGITSSPVSMLSVKLEATGAGGKLKYVRTFRPENAIILLPAGSAIAKALALRYVEFAEPPIALSKARAITSRFRLKVTCKEFGFQFVCFTTSATLAEEGDVAEVNENRPELKVEESTYSENTIVKVAALKL